MDPFLNDRHKVSSSSGKEGKITAGKEFQSIGQPQADPQAPEAVPHPEADSTAPKVEVVKEGDVVTHIIVTLGEQRIELKCEY